MKIKCDFCNGKCIKNGFQSNRNQRYKCSVCQKRQQSDYGNIAKTNWATNSDAGIIRSYGYKYDNLNRLKEGMYKNGTVLNAYNEALTYDKNGNILGFTRNGTSETATQIDNLAYTYASNDKNNQLAKVVDSSNKTLGFVDNTANTDDYSYDANGNMTADNNKNITAITYNHLNLPIKITFASTGNIVYLYNATGQKVQKIVNATSLPAVTTDYLGGYQYVNTTPKFFPTAEGYVEVSGSSYKYIYQYKDHLGNIRLSYDKTLVIKEENNYYPFGLKQESYNTIKNGVENKYKFSGKELQDELGLNMYDYGARNYDPALGRWMNIDPLAELSRRWSPYNYAYNNPNYFIDPDGMLVDTSKIKEEGKDDGSSMGKYLEEQAEISNETNKSFKAYLESLSNESEEDESEDEEPVSLFSSGNNRFDGVVKSRNYKKGDRSFTVYSHGAVHFMFDELGRFTVRNAEDFDKMMGALNDQWDDGKDKKGTTLSLWTCESARIGKNGLSLAQMISEAHPNIIVIGADGYVNYREIDNKIIRDLVNIRFQVYLKSCIRVRMTVI